MSKIAVIGAGFSGLSAAAYIAQAGHHVHVFEKNSDAGGRARQLKTPEGYVFDMGPSWYWMPGVFEKFFADFGYNIPDLYNLKLLSPAFEIIFGKDDLLSIPSDYNDLLALFESIEKGAATQLEKFMDEAQKKYVFGIEDMVYKPALSFTEFASLNILKASLKMNIFSSFSSHVRKYFKDPKLIALMEFPVLFLGAMPQDTPALYSLMNYAGLKLGTWYPEGGFGKVIDGMVKIAADKGAIFHFNAPVEQIILENNIAKGLMVNGAFEAFDGIVASADYHHIEKHLLPPKSRNYSNNYWDKRTFAPSCLIFYIGLNKKLEDIHHHTLFFDKNLDAHSREIYKNPRWPEQPLFYVCCPSRSDDSVAPPGHENLFLLMPIAPGLEDTEALRDKYFEILMDRLESHLKQEIRPHIDYKKSYCVNDFITDYNAFKGNAYGLANTLRQTAFLKPRIRNQKIKNLFYCGQLTVPGPGVPPSIISGKIAAEQLLLHLNVSYEITV